MTKQRTKGEKLVTDNKQLIKLTIEVAKVAQLNPS